MDKSTFCSLPPSQALGYIYDLIGGKLQPLPDPPKIFAPKFDTRISRKGGQYVWASELDLSGLQFFYGRAASAPKDGQYAERNEKDRKSLEYWIRYRECFPYTPWSGERNKQPATGAVPSDKPKLHDWEPKGGSSTTRTTTTSTGGGGGYVEESYDDDTIPF